MKRLFFITISCFFILTNCSLNDDSSTPPQQYDSLWHLTNVSGGISGVDEDYAVETIIWSFDDATLKLTVNNNNQDDSLEDGLDSDTYDFSILETDGKSYLLIDGNELGELIFSQTGMIIDGNKLSTGVGADGFIYTFQLQLVPVN
ncbi:hypothetical protein [Changchengzhania lutea]|uniref:hypothetical protein n=1 Tax=Changchengzhania lutea TaxID=2049305 RepID=UPI00115E1596|nr:hypothetical protein [Changchengzhania lutea]